MYLTESCCAVLVHRINFCSWIEVECTMAERKPVSLQLFHPRVNEIRPWCGSSTACPLQLLSISFSLFIVLFTRPDLFFSFQTDVHGIPITLSLRTFTEHKSETETADRRKLIKKKELNLLLSWLITIALSQSWILWEASIFKMSYSHSFWQIIYNLSR